MTIVLFKFLSIPSSDLIRKGKKSSNIWIGLRDNDIGTEWHWTDKSPLGFTNWSRGQPNGKSQHCAAVS